MQAYINKLICADALHFLPKIAPASIDVVLTDPPYFLDKLDHGWDRDKVHSTKNHYVVKSLPAGMKFDKAQGQRFYDWYRQVSTELYRVLKPGGFFFSFSSPRLYHRMACGMEDAGFEIRDCFIWLYTKSQAKAMGLQRFIQGMDLPEKESTALSAQLQGWKTPQVKSCFEPIAMGKKPLEGTYLENMIRHGTGLINTAVKQGAGENMFPSNVMSAEPIGAEVDAVFLTQKPTKKEKGAHNDHKTVKPLSLCKYLLSLSTRKDALVLDPFMGSGTTALACQALGRNFVGIELHKAYIDMAKRRLHETMPAKNEASYFLHAWKKSSHTLSLHL